MDVTDFGITADGVKDQTANIQDYLDGVSENGGGTAFLPAGQYEIKGNLKIPPGVMLSGSWKAPHHGILNKGTVLKAHANRGSEDRPPFIQLNEASGVEGITILYPEQVLSEIVAYPWTIQGRGMHVTLRNITLVNSYNGIAMGPAHNELHLIRNIFGCVLRRGIFIDNTTDIGRIENVHFNPHYWARSGHEGAFIKDADPSVNKDLNVGAVMQRNLEAFIFGRTDWEYVLNTFVFGPRVGYKFIKTPHGMCNGQFTGIGSDASQYCVLVEDTQGPGLLITNGEFVCINLQEEPINLIGVVTKPTFEGSLQLTNSAFWGKFHQFMKIEGSGYVSVSQANMQGNEWKEKLPAIDVQGGRVVIRDVFFKDYGPHVKIGENVINAIVTGNSADGGIYIINKAGEKAQVFANEEQTVDDGSDL
ncbi:MAG: glycosyl hydrolase family 28-related protein [Candidatus Hodarchaeota archaeon]